jgi:hypothetical protein
VRVGPETGVVFLELTFVCGAVASDAVGFGLDLRVTEATRRDFVVLPLPVGCVCDPKRNGVGEGANFFLAFE